STEGGTMQYMLLLYNDEKEWAALTDDERTEIVGRYLAFSDSIRESGNYIAGAPLQPTSMSTSVRVREGETLVTDGPFAETKEQLGGYYLVEAADADEALELAARVPGARYGTIEVRPVMPIPRGRLRDGGGRPRLPRGVGTCGRRSRARASRPRPGRGRRPGGLRRRARAMAPGRRPRQPSRVDRHDRAEQGDRPAPPRARPRAEAGGAGAPGRAHARPGRGGAAGDLDSGRAAGADLHLLPPCARRRGPGRAHPAPPRRPDGRRDRARVPLDRPEALGLLALMLLHDARRAARLDDAGEPVLLEDQDRDRWNRPQIDDGKQLLERALRLRRAGPYQIQAAVAALHTEEETDWPQIAALYWELGRLQPSPVVELNRAAAIAMADGAERGLLLIDSLEGLGEYAPFHSARGELLRRLDRLAEAADAYRRALELSAAPAERAFLERRLAAVTS